MEAEVDTHPQEGEVADLGQELLYAPLVLTLPKYCQCPPLLLCH